MNYAFPISRTELLLSSGFSLLWQCLELSQDSKLAKDNHKSLKAIVNLLRRDSQSMASDFQRMAHALFATSTPSATSPQFPGHEILNFVLDRSSMPAPQSRPQSARRQLQAIASRFSFVKPHQPRPEDARRRASVPRVDPSYVSSRQRTSSQFSLSSTDSLPLFSINSPPTAQTFMDLPSSTVNLDYLALGEDQSPTVPNLPREEDVGSPGPSRVKDLEDMDSLNPDMCGGLYNGVLQNQISQSRLDLDVTALTNPQGWLDQEWPVSALDTPAKAPVPGSLLSTSEGSIKSVGEDFNGCYSHKGSTSSAHTDHFDVGGETFGGTTLQNLD